MWRTGARGNRVSPDPWGSDYEDEPITDRQDNNIKMQEQTYVPEPVPQRQKTPPKSPELDVPKEPVYIAPIVPLKEPKEPSNEMNGTVIPPKEPDRNFVYHPDPRKDVTNEELDKYLKARFSTATHVWTPYLGERRR